MIDLTPAEILMLHYATLYTSDRKNNFQNFWNFRYNINNPQQLLDSLQHKGYIAVGDASDQLQHLSVTDIKKLLTDNGLKASGKKADLITRLIDNIDTNAICKNLPHFFTITDKGIAVTKTPEYDCVMYLHNNQSLNEYGLNINSVHSLIQEGEYKQAIVNDLLKQATPPFYMIAGIYSELEDYENAFIYFISDLRIFLEGQQHQFHDPMTAPVLAANMVKFIYPYENSLLRIPVGRLRPLRDVISALRYNNDQLQEKIKHIVLRLSASQFFFSDSDCIQIIYSELIEDKNTLIAIYKDAERRFRGKYGLN